MSDNLMVGVRDEARRSARPVSCRLGCSACCNYFVPVSGAEALALHRWVHTLPRRTRRHILAKTLRAGEAMLRAGTPPTKCESLSEWYAGLGLSCPFLRDGACTIYDRRPLACREHLTACSPDACATGQARPIAMPVSVAAALCDLSGRFAGQDAKAIPLPLAIPWAADHLELDARMHDMDDLLATLDAQLAESVRKSALAVSA